MSGILNKKTEKRIKILDSAFSLFQQKSVAATAIDDIVKASGIARGTFYLYFKDKSDLLEQIIMYKSLESIKGILRQTTKKIEEERPSFIEICNLFIDDYIDFLVMNKDILAVVQKNISSGLKALPLLDEGEIAEQYNSILMKFVEFGYDETTARKTIYIVLDLVGSVCSDAVLYSKPFSIEEIRENVKFVALNIIENGKNIVNKECD